MKSVYSWGMVWKWSALQGLMEAPGPIALFVLLQDRRQQCHGLGAGSSELGLVCSTLQVPAHVAHIPSKHSITVHHCYELKM